MRKMTKNRYTLWFLLCLFALPCMGRDQFHYLAPKAILDTQSILDWYNRRENTHIENQSVKFQPDEFGRELTLSSCSSTSPNHIEINEDSHFMEKLEDGTVLMGVFDGMGGQIYGALASEFAKNEVLSLLKEKKIGSSKGSESRIMGEALKSTSRVLSFLGKTIFSFEEELRSGKTLKEGQSNVLKALRGSDRKELKKVLEIIENYGVDLFFQGIKDEYFEMTVDETISFIEQLIQGRVLNPDLQKELISKFQGAVTILDHQKAFDKQLNIEQVLSIIMKELKSSKNYRELRKFIQENGKFILYSTENRILEYLSPGTTASICTVTSTKGGERKFYIANVGDSKAYLHFADVIVPATIVDLPPIKKRNFSIADINGFYYTSTDYFLDRVESLEGISDEERRAYKDRRLIANHLSDEIKDHNIIISHGIIADGESFALILVSDGVSDNLTMDEIEKEANRRAKSPHYFSLGLVLEALKRSEQKGNIRSKSDDITAVSFFMTASTKRESLWSESSDISKSS